VNSTGIVLTPAYFDGDGITEEYVNPDEIAGSA
jgi:hypothetical protein